MASLGNWQITCTTARSRTKFLLENKLWTDCEFVIGTNENMKTFSAHKLILSMASAVFEDMFYGRNAANEKPIIINDLKADTFEDILHYIYTDKWIVTTFERACTLCHAAMKYMLPDLKTSCITYLQEELKPSNVCQGYEFAHSIEATMLKKQCLELIRNKTKVILEEPNFYKISETTFLLILDQDYLDIDSEVDLYKALMKYIELKEAGNETSDDTVRHSLAVSVSDESHANMSVNSTCPTGTQFIERALRKIRFLSMDATQFCKEVTNFVDESDAFKILVNISYPSTEVPMPDGFCNITKPRKPPVLERTFSEPALLSPRVRRKSISGLPKGVRNMKNNAVLANTNNYRRSVFCIGKTRK
ncbi:hypothetical protein ACFFRR_007538 [Megaselia abdita]